jgi:phenylpropionate dioxygenase-like ring-hydroxylating dioxygenase large terminal subunit
MAVLFRNYPILVAHASQLAEPGSFVTLDAGSLKFVPDQQAFPDLDISQRGLVELSVVEQAGFVWVVPGGTPPQDNFLGELEQDLVEFGLPDHVVRVSDVQRPACNWKLVIDVFSEGYHVKSLHGDSLDSFLKDHGTLFERIGRPSRSVGARKGIEKARECKRSIFDICRLPAAESR